MGKRRRRNKPKKLTIEFLPREDSTGQVREPYAIMERLIATERADLVQARIGIAWRIGWKRDKDGLLKCGQCKKRSELDRTLDAYDFVILLNKEAWPGFTPEQRERLIYHELCHAQIEIDDGGDEKRDEAGRLVIRGRKHDIQDFRDVVERYGWDQDLSDLAQRNIADADRPLLAACNTTSAAAPPEPASDESLVTGDVPPSHKAFPLKLAKMFGATCKVVLTQTASGWEGWIDIFIPHAETRVSLAAELGEACDSRHGLIDGLLNGLVEWLRDQTAYDRRGQLEKAIRKALAKWQVDNA